MQRFVIIIYFLVFLINFAVCQDFYIGMFKKNDYLMAQDRLYKERVPFVTQYARYGRVFKCPITYIRVVDRLGYGKGPRVEIMRGGLQKKYVMLRISAYNKPISVNMYVGCENKGIKSITKPSTASTTENTVRGNDTQSTAFVSSDYGQVTTGINGTSTPGGTLSSASTDSQSNDTATGATAEVTTAATGK